MRPGRYDRDIASFLQRRDQLERSRARKRKNDRVCLGRGPEDVKRKGLELGSTQVVRRRDQTEPFKRTLTLPFGGVGRIRWTSNGRGLAFIDTTESNVWIQPFDGHPPQQLTRFADGQMITDFAWSPDGTRLAVARASTTTDIVLFKGLRR